MISSQQARDLGSWEARKATYLEAIENKIREAAPTSKSTQIFLDLRGARNEQMLKELKDILIKENFNVSSHEVDIQDGGPELKPRVELQIDWSPK